MKKVLIVVVLSILFVPQLKAQDPQKSIYSGGMLLLQPGLTITNNKHQDIAALSNSIGGILRLYFFDYLTVGIYGGSQKTNYKTAGSDNSYINLGYGGPFVGFSRELGRFRYTASAFIGMGSIKNLHIDQQNADVLTDAHLYEYSTLLLSPILSVDYALTRRLCLTMQAICLSGSYGDGQRLLNPTLQVGLLFRR